MFKETEEEARRREEKLANRTPEEVEAERQKEKAARKARRLERKFERYLDPLLVKPWFARKPYFRSKGKTNEELRLHRIQQDVPPNYSDPYTKPYSFAFDIAARQEIATFITLAYPEDPFFSNWHFDTCRWVAIRRICYEVIEARVPAAKRRYFFDPRTFRRFEWKRENHVLQLLSLNILIDPRGELREECIALAMKLDARGDAEHSFMVFNLSTNRLYGLRDTNRIHPENFEMVPYTGPTSEDEWWAAVHATSDRPISGLDPTRRYPPVTEDRTLLTAKKLAEYNGETISGCGPHKSWWVIPGMRPNSGEY
jgi:hypothetical protein